MTTTDTARAPDTRAAPLPDLLADLTVIARLARLPMATVAGSEADRTLHVEVPATGDVVRWATALMVDPRQDSRDPVPGTRRTVLVVQTHGWTVHLFNTTPKVTP